MQSQFSRQELYDLALAQPMRDMAATMNLSDVGLAKIFKKANIPVPARRYRLSSVTGCAPSHRSSPFARGRADSNFSAKTNGYSVETLKRARLRIVAAASSNSIFAVICRRVENAIPSWHLLTWL
jgi:hypothetical protein